MGVEELHRGTKKKLPFVLAPSSVVRASRTGTVFVLRALALAVMSGHAHAPPHRKLTTYVEYDAYDTRNIAINTYV